MHANGDVEKAQHWDVRRTLLAAVAERSVELFEIWGEEIVFKDVLVSRNSKDDQERQAVVLG